jgi:hypothetical protein
MQNTFFPDNDLKEIERLVYKFIWNGPDKIKRSILQKDYKDGGLKSPNVFELDRTLKLKQMLRASKSSHSISIAQGIKITEYQPIIFVKTNNNFIQKAANTYNVIGSNVLQEILLNQEGNIHRDHMQQLGNTKIIEFVKAINKLNPMRECVLINEIKKTKIETLTSLVECNNINGELKNIKNMIPEHIQRRITTDELLRDETASTRICNKIPIRMNLFRETAKLKHREIFISNHTDEDLMDDNLFLRARKIKHPRERMIQFMSLHKKTYTNEKLCRLKITNNNKCDTCMDVVETLDHLTLECPRSNVGWKIYNEITKEEVNGTLKMNGPKDARNLNLYSLIKRTIFTFRDQPINEDLLRFQCSNRVKDLETIVFHQFQQKNLRMLKHDLFKKAD